MWPFKKKEKKTGCLDGKTDYEKEAFFKSLARFMATDMVFFKEQLLDLLPNEKEEFQGWINVALPSKILLVEHIIEKFK